MKEDLINEFLDTTKPGDYYIFNASLAPLLTLVPWTDADMKNNQIPFPLLMMNSGSRSFAVVSESLYKKPALDAFKEYWNEKTTLEHLRAPYEVIYKEINDSYHEFFLHQENLKEFSEEKIISHLKLIIEKLSVLIARTLFLETMDKDMCIEGVGDQDLVEKIWEEATHPSFESFEVRRKRDLKNIILKAKNIDAATDYAQYIYIDYYKPKPIEFIKKDIENFKEIEHNNFKEESQSFNVWKETLPFRERKIVDYIQFVMEGRDVRKDPIAKSQVLIFKYAEALAIRAGIKQENITNITGLEYMNGLTWIKDHSESLESPLGRVLLLYPNFELKTEVSDYDQAVEKFMALTNSLTSVKEIKGQCASKGNVTGPVQVVLEVGDTTIFKEGSVLVTSMTRPEFVPFMKQAIAVVTNEGGITCHAAIISRELGIPCVIGTKLATQILKDGDIVEVNANTGIVKII